LSTSNFWLFDHIKPSLGGCVFDDIDELFEAVIESFNDIQPSELQLVLTTGSNECKAS
jgi:hypothetical protein